MSGKIKLAREERLDAIFQAIDELTPLEKQRLEQGGILKQKDLEILVNIRYYDLADGVNYHSIRSAATAMGVSRWKIENTERLGYEIFIGETMENNTKSHFLAIQNLLYSKGFSDKQIIIVTNYLANKYGTDKSQNKIESLLKDYVSYIGVFTHTMSAYGFSEKDTRKMIGLKPALADYKDLRSKKQFIATTDQELHPFQLTLILLMNVYNISSEKIVEHISDILTIEKPWIFRAREYFYQKEGNNIAQKTREDCFLATESRFNKTMYVTTKRLNDFYNQVIEQKEKYEGQGMSEKESLRHAINDTDSPRKGSGPIPIGKEQKRVRA